jgi:hypothetical protein
MESERNTHNLGGKHQRLSIRGRVGLTNKMILKEPYIYFLGVYRKHREEEGGMIFVINIGLESSFLGLFCPTCT